MSGGSYDYIYSRLSEECENRMYDAEMDDLIKDLCEVLHDLEWWQSADSSEDKYRATLDKFKAKWFKGNREERLKGYIDDQIVTVRKQLYALIGESTGAESKHSTIEELEQEPKTGHWKVVSDEYGDAAYICECSECKDTVWVYKVADRKWNYCPNCGAKMAESEDKE